MSLKFQVEDWIGTGGGGGDESAMTLAALRIEAGPQQVPMTQVFDTIAQTVRDHIYVPVHPIAQWLLANWWRLRWEPQRKTVEWRLAHSMASIGGGYAWPDIEFSGCGDFVQIHLGEEVEPDMAAIRYLKSVVLDIPAIDFEAAVDELVDLVQDRLSALRQRDSELDEVRLELAEERSDADLARESRLQALAGIDPGCAPEGWLDKANRLADVTGLGAIEEVMAVLPDLGNDLERAREGVEVIRQNPTVVDLSWVGSASVATGPELPWQKGERLAAEARARLGCRWGPISDDRLGQCLAATLPLQHSPAGPLRGGFRNGNGNTRVVVRSPYPENQRFFLARLIGCSLVTGGQDLLLPVLDAQTALQKFERAFAQELLCPWAELEEFIDRRGLDDEAISEAARHFKVSERLIESTLVNKKKMPRDLLGFV